MSKHMAIKDKLPPFTLAVWCNGPACGNPAAFTNVAMAAGQYGAKYVEGVRANLMAGGDNCSRSCLIGALLAAEVRGRDPGEGRGIGLVLVVRWAIPRRTGCTHAVCQAGRQAHRRVADGTGKALPGLAVPRALE